MFDNAIPDHAAATADLVDALRDAVARNALDEIGAGLDWLTITILHNAAVTDPTAEDDTLQGIVTLAAAYAYLTVRDQDTHAPDMQVLRRAENSLLAIITSNRYSTVSMGLAYIWLSQVYHAAGRGKGSYQAVQEASRHLRTAGELSNALASLLYVRLLMINWPNRTRQAIGELKSILSKLDANLAGHQMLVAITRLWLVVAYRRQQQWGRVLWHALLAGYGFSLSRLPSDEVALDLLPPIFELTQ